MRTHTNAGRTGDYLSIYGRLRVMGLFESVQLELFDFLGYKKPANQPKTQSFDDFKFPVNLIRKSHLRGIRFNISKKAILEITASKSASDKEILNLIHPYMDWINKEYENTKKLHSNYPQKFWRSGEGFDFNGKKLTLFLSPSRTKKSHIRFMENSFEFFYPEEWQSLNDFNQKLNSEMRLHFKLKASEILDLKVRYWSEKMKLFPKRITYRNQKTRWGSCSSSGSINLNWRLAVFRPEIQDYVIIHELAHLQQQNHSSKFWQIVESYMPHRKRIEKELQNTAHLSDYLCKESELYDWNPYIIIS